MDPLRPQSAPGAGPPSSWPPPATPRSLGASLLGHATLAAAALAVTAVPIAILGGERDVPQRSVAVSVEDPRPTPEPPVVEPEYEVSELEPFEPLPEVETSDVADTDWSEPDPPELVPVDFEATLREMPLDVVLVRPAVPPAEPEAETTPVAVLPPAAPPELEPPATEPLATIETAAEPMAGRCPKPPYPLRAVTRGWEGTVVCGITVAADGTVKEVVVRESSGHRMLDDAVRDTVLEWRFHPASRAGATLETVIVKRFEFRLDR